MYETPQSDQFTQGTIFSCAYAENYPTDPVYGLVITARCDASQDKASIYNFIPVIALKDWVLGDGAEIILQRAQQDAVNTLKNILTAGALSDSLLRTHSISEILESHLLPKSQQEKKWEARVQQFIDAADLSERIGRALDENDREARREILKKSPKHIDVALKELAGNRLSGHYLLKQMPDLYSTEGRDHVALLREIHHIPSKLAREITRGIAKEVWLKNSNPATHGPRFCGQDDYCVPVARLKSPWIEHLMQSLTMLFARIGIEDVDYLSLRESLTSIGLEKQ